MTGRGRSGLRPTRHPRLTSSEEPEPPGPKEVPEPTQLVEAVTLSLKTLNVGRGRGRSGGSAMGIVTELQSERTLSNLPLLQGRGMGSADRVSEVIMPAPGVSGNESPIADSVKISPVVLLHTSGRGRGLRRVPVSSSSLQSEATPLSTLTHQVSVGVILASTSGITMGVPVSASVPGSGSNTSAEKSASSCASQLLQPPTSTVTRAEGLVVEPPISEQIEELPSEQQPVKPVSHRGDKGTKVRVMANFLRMRIAEGRGLHEYKVMFEPHLEDTRIRKQVINSLVETLGQHRTFDGMKLYLPFLLSEKQLGFITTHPNDPTEQLKITLKVVKVSTNDVLQFYNVLLRRIMIMLEYTEINRDYYNPKKVHPMTQHNLEVWPGYITAIDVYDGGLMLCLNSTSRVLRKDNVLTMLNNAKQKDSVNYKKVFEEMIVGKSIITRYNNCHYRVDDVDWNQTPRSTFDRKGTQISYADYFQSQHGKKIFDLTQPILASRVKPKKNDPKGETYYLSLIPELCNQSGMTDEMRANFNLMRDLITFSRTSPNQRHASIMEFVYSVNNCAPAQELLAAWGASFENECLIDTGRLIPGPTLQLKTLSLKVAPADFTREVTSNKCFLPVTLKRWQIYCTGQDRDKADKFVINYKQVAPALGITFGPEPEYVIISNRTGRGMPSAADLRQAIKQSVKIDLIQFIVVVLPMARDDLYAAVKRQVLTDYSIPSQCILGKTLIQDKKVRSVMQKVALQINCKLGGALWALNIPLKEHIMFIGIDSHHDPSQKKKSVLALVASLDNECTQYYSRIVNQMAHQESADAIRPVFIQALGAFFEHNHHYPDRIVIFRDGVGDGQLEIVRSQEVAQLRTAANVTCQETPKFLFVVVQKRINERIFLCNRNQLDNPAPGTVVDHTITRRGLYDFFLVSQLIRQGTVGPSHYIVLEDSGENKPDLVQRFSYVTSYMYYNWPGSVRVPAMCQYAHKLAMLTGQHLDKDPLATMDRHLYYL